MEENNTNETVAEPDMVEPNHKETINEDASVMGIVKNVWSVFKQNWIALSLAAGLPTAIMIVLGGLVLAGLAATLGVDFFTDGEVSDVSGGALGAVFLLGLVGFVAVAYFSIRMTVGIIRSTLDKTGEEMTFQSIFSDGADGMLNYFIVSAVYGLIIAGGLVLLILPGIYFALKYFMMPVLAVTENLSVGEAMKRSDELTKGRYGVLAGLFGVLILVNIGAEVINEVIPLFSLAVSVALSAMTIVGYAVIYKKFLKTS